MADTTYRLLGRLDDDSWERVGNPCPELSTCKSDAYKFTQHYSRVEVRDQGSGRVVYRAVRGAASSPRWLTRA